MNTLIMFGISVLILGNEEIIHHQMQQTFRFMLCD